MSDTATPSNTHVRFRIRSVNVISEEVAGQSVIIDFDSGSYFSLNETGSLLWRYFAQGNNVAEIRDTIDLTAGFDHSDLQSMIVEFADLLSDNQLIVPLDSRDEIEPPVLSETQFISAVPALDKFDDLQDMLLLDPIHEVDEQGWPHAR